MVFGIDFEDPKFWLRVRTAVKTALVVVLYSLLIFLYSRWDGVPLFGLILGACFLPITMHSSIMGTFKNNMEATKSGFYAFVLSLIVGLISSNGWFHVVCIFAVSFAYGMNDPFLARSTFTKLGVLDAFCMIFQPGEFRPLEKGIPYYFFVCHIIAFGVAFLVSIIVWPQVSSNQFMKEMRFCLRYTRELFLLLSLKMDTEVIPHDNDKSDGVFFRKVRMDLSDKNISRVEHEYSKRIIRLGRLLKESKLESWSAKRNAQYDKMLDVLERLLRQLASTREAISMGKFSRGINNNLVAPMFPLLEALQASILEQLDYMVAPEGNHTPSRFSLYADPSDKLAPRSSTLSPEFTPSTKPTQEFSFQAAPTMEPDDISRQMDEKYTSMVKQFEADNKSANPSREISRMVFTIFGAVEFSQWLHKLEVCMSELPTEEPNAALAVLKDLFNDIISWTPLTLFKWMFQQLKDFYATLQILFYTPPREVIASPKLRFPLRFAIGLTLLAVLFQSLPDSTTDKIPYYNPTWAATTYVVAILPSLGATIRKCFHRVTGTIIGAFAGYGSIAIVMATPDHIRIVPYILLVFTFLLFSSYISQIPKFAYSGTVANLSYMIVVMSEYVVESADVEMAAMRTVFIIIGIVWALIFSLLIFPNRSEKLFRAKLVDCNKQAAKLFSMVIQKAISADMGESGAKIPDAMKAVKASYQLLRTHLKEAKSELLIFGWDGFKLYGQALAQIHSVYYTIAYCHTIIEGGFSPFLYNDVVYPLRTHLNGLMAPVLKSAERVVEASGGKATEMDPEAGLLSISQAMTALDNHYIAVRKNLLSQKSLGALHPQLRQFYAFLFAVREFVREWKGLEESLFASFGVVPEVYISQKGADGAATVV